MVSKKLDVLLSDNNPHKKTTLKVLIYVAVCILSLNIGKEKAESLKLEYSYTYSSVAHFLKNLSWDNINEKKKLFSFYEYEYKNYGEYYGKYTDFESDYMRYDTIFEFNGMVTVLPYDAAHTYVLHKWEQLGILGLFDDSFFAANKISKSELLQLLDNYKNNTVIPEYKEKSLYQYGGIKHSSENEDLKQNIDAYETLVYGGDILSLDDGCFLNAIRDLENALNSSGISEKHSFSLSFFMDTIYQNANRWVYERLCDSIV